MTIGWLMLPSRTESRHRRHERHDRQQFLALLLRRGSLVRVTSRDRLSDTTAEAAAVYVASYSCLSGGERVERAMEMAEDAKQVTLAGIAHRNPHFDADDLRRAWLRLLHGEALAALIS